MSDLDKHLSLLKAKLGQSGLSLCGEKPLAYGVQLSVTDGASTLPVNIYSGKKGISTVIGGGAKSQLKLAVSAALESPVTDHPGLHDIPPGFEQVADFDYTWIGTDESGKGDFFGPLVVAAVRVDKLTAERLTGAGVKDSKALSDIKAKALAAKIREICPDGFVELEIKPARYNSLYDQLRAEGKNLNHLLAWAHARVLEDLLHKAPCRFAIADKFANEKFIMSRLMAKGRQVNLVQTPRAERNVAVAAASILARDRFLTSMEDMADRFQMMFPKGASSLVIEAAQKFSLAHGKRELVEVAKVHFKTIDQI